LDGELSDAHYKAARLQEARDEARVMVTASIRLLEARLKALVKVGGVLRGMPSLGGAVSGIRVNSAQLDSLPMGGRGVLVLTNRGELVVASRRVGRRGLEVDAAPVRDEELVAEDLEDIVRAAHLALQWHLDRIEKRAGVYEEIEGLARRLTGILSGLASG
jgi:hypothetical protein